MVKINMSKQSIDNNVPKIDEQALLDKLCTHLRRIYTNDVNDIAQSILSVVKKYTPFVSTVAAPVWDHRDMILITYGDSIIREGEKPLQTLLEFLNGHVGEVISSVHILPFFPYSSDDGFSVIDYRQVNTQLGDWNHINALSADYKLMFDLVINHTSRENLWFYDFVEKRYPACEFFIEMSPDEDLSAVVRPRSSPLLSAVNTHRGTKYLWATFSEDQIDLDFSNPQVLQEFIDILFYYLANGARYIRLDAIAFLWKEVGTSCIHLPQTHEIVMLMRTLFDHLAPDCVLLTETNVPHEENMSYFGDANEAHMVYQFSLPPLLLHAMNRGSSTYLTQWAASLPKMHERCTYLNFSASHDGIGLRSLEGILPQHEVDDLLECMHRFGGFVSMKKNSDGSESPYEINISLFDAMQGIRLGPDQWQTPRFICSQAIVMAMQGIPAIYIHSLTATPNDLHSVEMSGRTRSINRKKWQYDELIPLLENPNTPNQEVFNAILGLGRLRKEEPCFHPDHPQTIINLGSPFFTLIRHSPDGSRKLIAVHNITPAPQKFSLVDCKVSEQYWYDLLTETEYPIDGEILLQPYQYMWLLHQA